MIIHDCDNALGLFGSDVDDGLALLYLLARQDLSLAALTTCFGNASLPRVTNITAKLLAYMGRADLPLFAGARRAEDRSTDAARFLVEAAAEHPGRITLVATGPLTNLAAAAAHDSRFFSRLDRVICLGGNLFPARLGWRPVNELNFGADEQAARRVLRADCPVVVVPATSCLPVTFGRADLPRLAGLGAVFRRILARWLHCCRIARGLDHFVLWDILPVMFLTNPELFLSQPAGLELGPDARLRSGAGDRHRLVTGVRDAAAVKEAWFAAIGRMAVQARA